MNWVNLLMLFMVLSSPIIAISSINWFFLWCSFEINLLTFLPLMYNKNNLSIHSMIKYFIVQSFASSLFILAMILSKFIFLNEMMNFSISLSMIAKLGLSPMHFWLPQVMEGLNWLNFFLLSTWQKIIPFFVLSLFLNMSLMITSITLSCLISSISLFNLTSLRKILAYSSISHMAWMLSSLWSNSLNWLSYLIFYSMILAMGTLIFWYYNFSSTAQLKLNQNYVLLFYMVMFFISMSGIPPFTGFFMKMMIILNNMDTMMLMNFFLIFSSILSCFIYIRSFYPNFTSMKITKNLKFMNHMFFWWFMIMNLTLFMLIPYTIF